MKIILKEGEEAEAFIERIIEKTASRIAMKVDNRLEEMSQNNTSKRETKWVSTTEAKKILGIKSKGKMQQIRDESPMNGIIISQHGRTFRYERASLYKYLKKHILT